MEKKMHIRLDADVTKMVQAAAKTNSRSVPSEANYTLRIQYELAQKFAAAAKDLSRLEKKLRHRKTPLA